jgi:hypothetical protein
MPRLIQILLPAQIDNGYNGERAGLCLFAVTVVLKLIIGANSAINTRAVASGADGLAVGSPTAGPDTILSLFALLGVGQFTLGLLGLVVLARYRRMIPLVFLLFLIDHLGRKAVAAMHPAEAPATSAGFYINVALLAVMAVGFALTFSQRRAD